MAFHCGGGLVTAGTLLFTRVLRHHPTGERKNSSLLPCGGGNPSSPLGHHWQSRGVGKALLSAERMNVPAPHLAGCPGACYSLTSVEIWAPHSSLCWWGQGWITVLSVVLGWSTVVIYKKVFAFQDCPFPDLLGRKSRLCWCFLPHLCPLVFLVYCVLQF